MIQDLDLVEEADKITHNVGLDDDLELEEDSNYFSFDPTY